MPRWIVRLNTVPHTIDSASIQDADGVSGLIDSQRDGELALGGYRTAKTSDRGGVVGIDRECGDRIRPGL